MLQSFSVTNLIKAIQLPFKKLLFPFPRNQMLHEAPVLVPDRCGTPTYPDSSSTHTCIRYLGFVQVYSLVVALPFMNRFFSSLASTFSLSPSHISGWSHEHRCLVKELVLYRSASKFLLWGVSERASHGKQGLCSGSHCVFPANQTMGACAVPRC